MEIRGIIFDLEGGLFPDGKERFINSLCEEFKLDREQAYTLFFSSERMQSIKRGTIPDSTFWSHFTISLNIRLNEEQILDRVSQNYKPDLKFLSIVKACKAKGYKTMICSNNFKSRIEILDTCYHFLSNFDYPVFSYQVGALKLEGFEMFKKIVELSSIPPEQILLIDNGEENLRHAKEFGFLTLLYKTPELLLQEIESYGIKI